MRIILRVRSGKGRPRQSSERIMNEPQASDALRYLCSQVATLRDRYQNRQISTLTDPISRSWVALSPSEYTTPFSISIYAYLCEATFRHGYPHQLSVHPQVAQ